MAITPDRSWQPPLFEATGGEKMGYINDVVRATEGIVTKQPGFREMDSGIAMISGRYERRPIESRSKLVIPRGKRALREVVANISDVRTVDAFTTENRAQEPNVALFNKLWRAVWFESKFSDTMREATQWLTVGGYSYISPVYRNLRLSARNKRAMAFDAFSVADCLPFQLPMNNKVQGAYAWTIIKFMPVFEAHAKFPLFQHLLKPVARRRYSGDAAKDRLALAERFRQDNLGIGATGGNWAEEFCEIRYTYIRDMRVNDLGKPQPMGSTGGALESYIVPYLGQQIPTGAYSGSTPITRKAEIEDCYLYPNLRLLISQTGMQRPMYDGPAYSWHGMFPIARFSADPWPWNPGYSLAKDIYSVDEAQQNFERGLDQTAKARFDPALMYDKSSVNKNTMASFDPYEERGRLGVEGGISETTVKTALPETLLNHPAWAYTYAEYLDKARSYLLGTDQMHNLAEAKMASTSGDVMQEALEDAGPIVKDISHGMESPMQDLMWMTLSDVLQYYPTGRVMNYVGADGVTMSTFDLNPDSLIPSHAANEDSSKPTAFTRMQRCQMFLDNFTATITPGALHGIIQTSQKLLLMQLQRSGFMISNETVAKAFDIPNYGSSEGNTEVQKWESEQEKKIEFAFRMQQVQAGLAATAPAMAPPQISPLANGHAQPGRPPSGNKPPELHTKGSAEGPRAVITES